LAEKNMKNLLDRYDHLLFADGFNEAVIGVSSDDKVVYSINKMLEILMEDGISDEEAIDYFYFNIEGAYMGEKTPIYIWTE
jgi:hypothetical protein